MNIKLLEISSNCTGGTNYTDRVLRALEKYDHVVVLVKYGEYQDQVVETIERHMYRLIKFSSSAIDVQIVKQGGMV